MPVRRLVSVVLLLLPFAASPAWAQRPVRPVPDTPVNPETAKFRLADAYLRAGQSDRALAILEDLHAADPTSFAVYDKLKEAYVTVKRYDDALALIDARIEQTAATPNLLAEAGRLHFLNGDLDTAEQTWQAALDAAPDNPSTYRLVYAAEVEARLFEQAIAVLLQGRERLGEPALFRAELAELYGRTAQHEESMGEYAALLSDEPGQLGLVQSRIGRMLDSGGTAEAFTTAVERLIRREPLVMAYRELAAWLYAETGDFPAALDATRALDRLRDEQGQSLYAFADAALTADAFDEALQAYEIILDRHTDGPMAPLALLSTGLLYELRGQRRGERAFDADGNRIPAADYDLARDRFEAFLRQHPTHPNYPVALRQLAGLQKDVFRDYGQAEALLREVLTRFPNGPVAARARLDLGEVALLRDDLGAARAAFTQVEESERIGEAAELARLELARLAFYEGQFEMAETRAQAMNRNTATDVANDAIALKLLLSENTGPDSTNAALRTFARAQLLQRQQRPALALASIDSLLAAFPQHALADDAHVLRADVLRALGRFDDALAVLAAFPEQFPDSHLADYSLFTVGETWERDLADPQAAQAAYADLLARYPGSLLAPEARARIRRLRGDGV
ncbi:MAG: tetratricopeptide repeat protein [Rhodothermales bacterium]